MRSLIIQICSLVLYLTCIGTANAENASRYNIAVIIPLTGGLAEYGEAIQNGFKIASDELPGLGKIVNFNFEDSKYDNYQTISIVNKVASDPAYQLVYLWGYGPAQAAVPIAERQHLPTFAITGEKNVNTGYKNVLRFCYIVEQYAVALLNYLRTQQFKKYGFIKTEIAYMNALIEAMQSNLLAGESIEIFESYQPSDFDFRSTILKIKRKSFDNLGVFLLAGQVSQFYKQASNLKYKIPTFGASPFENITEIEQAQGLMNGAVFPGLNITEDFTIKYQKKFGKIVQLGWAANAYDFAKLVYSVLTKDHDSKIDRTNILDRFKIDSIIKGAQGDYTYKQDLERGNGFEFKVVIKKIQGNGYNVIPESLNWE